jgi:acyl CoA:acetate/3-ketoacid CoA transferase alpha subunit
MMQVRQGRINFTTLAELPDGAPIMSGTFSIHHKPVVTLIDSGATHSFISNNCGTRIGLDLCPTQGSCCRTNLNYTGSSTRVHSQGLQRASNGIIPWPVR